MINETEPKTNELTADQQQAMAALRAGQSVFLTGYAGTGKTFLREQAYTGVLVNHRYTVQNGKKLLVQADEQFRHEHYYPVLIERSAWEQVQRLLDEQTAYYHAARPAMSNHPSHRYAGLLQCADCGATFVPIIRRWNGAERTEYICKTYSRHGKVACPAHRVHEETLDAHLQAYASALRDAWRRETDRITSIYKLYQRKAPALSRMIGQLKHKQTCLEQEIDAIVMEKLCKDTMS